MDVELRQIHKSFGAVHANDGISLMIPAGCIQGVLGENGAGKSTLMKILSGFQRADSGQIRLDGRLAVIDSPQASGRMGIGMLHQDPLDVPAMRVLDNFLLGKDGGLRPERGQARRALQELSGRFGFSLDPEAYVESLTVGERQQLELLRLLWLGARVLILDEPTTGISALQKEALFASLQRLSEDGRTIIFVSHKLEEVESLCHRVAVLRRGLLVGEAAPPYSTDRLVEMMFGRVVSLGSRLEAPPGGIVDRPVLVSLAGVDRAGVAAAHRDHDVGGAHDLIGERLRELLGHVDAELLHRLDDRGVELVGRPAARRADLDSSLRAQPDQPGGHLAAAGVVHAHEQHLGLLLHERL